MPTRKSTLAQTLEQAAGRTQVENVPAGASKRKPGNRDAAGTVLIAAHYPREVRATLKHIEADTGRTLRQLLGEAINDLAVKYGKPESFREE